MSPSELSLALASFQWEKAIRLVQSKPYLAKQLTLRMGFYEGKNDSEVLPLHEACTGTAPARVAIEILRAYPDAAKCPESAYKRLPLHCACRKHACVEIVKLLLETHAAAALFPDELGRLPIHYAISNGADETVIDLLLQSAPDSARGVDARGWTPLHVACSIGSTGNIIRKLLEIYPEATVIRTNKGSSAAGLLNKQSTQWKAIYSLLSQAKDDFDRRFVDPLAVQERSIEDLMIV